MVLFDLFFMSLAFMQSLYFSFISIAFFCFIIFAYMFYRMYVYGVWWRDILKVIWSCFFPCLLTAFHPFLLISCLLRIPFFLTLLSSKLVQIVVLCQNLMMISSLIRLRINSIICMLLLIINIMKCNARKAVGNSFILSFPLK